MDGKEGFLMWVPHTLPTVLLVSHAANQAESLWRGRIAGQSGEDKAGSLFAGSFIETRKFHAGVDSLEST